MTDLLQYQSPAPITSGTVEFLKGGDNAVRSHGKATLRFEAGFWIMGGPTGRHSLAELATDLSRLNAHWLPYCERANGIA